MDIHQPEVQCERLWSQDRQLLDAVGLLANTIRHLPWDPAARNTEPRALLVGGFVRDAMLGLKPKDLDVEVYGVSPQRLESLLDQLYPDRVNTVGRAFGIFKINLGAGVEFDISIPRRESKIGSGHTGFSVDGDPNMSSTEAARRRDFTVNSLCADPLTGEVFDAFGGLDDLQNRSLRVTDTERFQDDPLRVYRGVQFCARFGFTLEERSFRLMQEMVERGDLDELSRERVTEEIKKLLLKSPRPALGFELMRALGIIARDYPELNALINTAQEAEWHPEGDVWIHTLMALDQAARLVRQPERGLTEDEKLQALVGTLCHDLGKPSTTQLEEKNGRMRLRSLGHEEAGAQPTRELLTRWKFSDDVLRAALAIATQHLKPGMFFIELSKGRIDERQYANGLRKLLKRIAPVDWRVLLLASEADSRGRTLPGAQTDPYQPGERFAVAIQTTHLDEAAKTNLIQGRDLLALGLKPGRRFGEIIQAIEKLRDAGTISTREEALEEATRMIQS